MLVPLSQLQLWLTQILDRLSQVGAVLLVTNRNLAGTGLSLESRFPVRSWSHGCGPLKAWFKLTTSGGRWSQNKKCILARVSWSMLVACLAELGGAGELPCAIDCSRYLPSPSYDRWCLW